MRRNRKGKILTGPPVYSDPAFCVKLPNGNVMTDFKTFASDTADEHGFDTENREPNGVYTMDIVLPRGTQIIRYGPPYGHYSAPKDMTYEELALPYVEDSCEFHRYVVLDNIRVKCEVIRGRAAPNFHQPGGGVQYRHKQGIDLELQERKLMEVEISG